MSTFCEVCNIQLDESSFVSHLQGKKHAWKVDLMNREKRNLERSISVSGLPLGVPLRRIYQFFKDFAPVRTVEITAPGKAVIHFYKRDVTSYLLKTPIWFDSKKLVISAQKWSPKDRKGPAQTPENAENSVEKNFTELKTKLEAQTTFESEISTFLEMIQVDEKQVEKSWSAIQSTLLETLRPTFPKCEVFRFGSSITGLCFKESDFDIYVDVRENDSNYWPPKLIFNRAKKSFCRKNYIFKKIISIPKAKTPIIKLRHAPTDINCDISFKNGLGVINSQLIKKLLQLDDRLRPLMMIIKYWAAFNELSGCGKFTNYAIIMMIIFYLQQPDVKMLPTILELRKDCEPVYQWDWQINFDLDATFPSSDNKSSITELLAGFFKFYADFDFEKNMVSPVDGIVHPRANYTEKYAEKSGENPTTETHERPICVQDPIALNNNVTSGVSSKLLKTFQSFCSVGLEVCTTALKDPGKPFLLKLFVAVPLPQDEDNREHGKIVITARKSMIDKLRADAENKEDIVDKEKYAENLWLKVAQKVIEEAFTRIFKIEIQTKSDVREVKQQKVTQTSDVHSKDSDSVVLGCATSNYIMMKRKQKSSSIDPTLSPIDKEALISDEMIDKQGQEGVVLKKFSFTCVIKRERSPLRLILHLQVCRSVKKRLRPFTFFLVTKLPSVVDKQLVHIVQYDKLANY